MQAQIDEHEWATREPVRHDLAANRSGAGRELFGLMRAQAGNAEQGACSLFAPEAD